MNKHAVVLKKEKDSIFHRRHHWIFSRAIERYPDSFENGGVYPVFSSESTFLGLAYFNKRCSLAGRILSFEKDNVHEVIRDSLSQALELRRSLIRKDLTTAFRWVNGEGDHLPGLIVDLYGSVAVIQIGTLGIELLKPLIVKELCHLAPLTGIYEKSLLPTRKEEGLDPIEGTRWGEVPDEIEILEEQSRFIVAVKKGQKTGFFLDQREMRKWIGSLSKERKVLNCFSYSGGFSIAALKGGAPQVDSVDLSEDALQLARRNMAINGFDTTKHQTYCEDVFQFLNTHPLDYEIVILDPPAFAKKKEDIQQALKGYRRLNRKALEKMPKKSLLLTCSCSYHIDSEAFEMVIRQAALEAKRSVKVLGHHRLGYDHPINLFHPESSYLKSLLLYITG